MIDRPLTDSWNAHSGHGCGLMVLVDGLEHELYFSIQLGMSSSQLTNWFQVIKKERFPIKNIHIYRFHTYMYIYVYIYIHQ